MNKRVKKLFSLAVAFGIVVSVASLGNNLALAANRIASTKIKSITYNNNKLKVKWAKKSKVKGYQLQYATTKKFKKKKTVNIKKAKIVSKSIKNLKSGKTYYFKIRCYKIVKGKKAFSEFSKVKKYKIPIAQPAVPITPPAQALELKTPGDTMTSNITYYKYKLNFIDDFDGTQLNPNNWTFEEVNSNGSEIQKNVESNIEVSNGILHLYGRKEENADGTTSFTGTKITSAGKQSFKYGRLEARIKMPYGKGTFPAWWTVGTDEPWPWGGEIDIMEFTGGSGPYANSGFNSGIHWCSPGVEADAAYSYEHQMIAQPHALINFMSGEKLADNWHVYGVEWTERYLYFYFDGTCFNEIEIKDYTYSNAFHKKHFMILNFAFGGQAGTPDAKTVFPQQMQVDWVKVWQK